MNIQTPTKYFFQSLFVIKLFFMTSFCQSQTISISDSIFEKILIDKNIDSDGKINHKILKKDALKVTHLQINTAGEEEANKVKNIEGIEGFSNITDLIIAGTDCKSINLSQNKKLSDLKILYNYKINNIDVSQNTFLKYLDVSDNKLDAVNVSMLTNLITLECIENNLESIDVSKNINLEKLYLYKNNLTQIDLSNNKKLKVISLIGNKFKDLDLSNNNELKEVFIAQNKFLRCIKTVSNSNILFHKDNYQHTSENCE